MACRSTRARPLDGDNGVYGPYRQSPARGQIYQTFVKSLVQRGMAYPCFCTEEELAAAHAAQEANKENFGYYGKYAVWRDRPMEEIEAEAEQGYALCGAFPFGGQH